MNIHAFLLCKAKKSAYFHTIVMQIRQKNNNIYSKYQVIDNDEKDGRIYILPEYIAIINLISLRHSLVKMLFINNYKPLKAAD